MLTGRMPELFGVSAHPLAHAPDKHIPNLQQNPLRRIMAILFIDIVSVSEDERRAGYEPDTVGAFDAMSLRSLARAGWLNRDRIVAWGGILLALEMLFLGFMVLWDHDVFGRIDPPTTTDFVSFYAAGKLVLAGTPALAYNQAAHAAVEVATTAPGIGYQYFFYPPVYLL